MLKLLVSALLASSVGALSTALTSSDVFAGLQATPLVRASDAAPTTLTTQWRKKTPFGVADETAVVAFLRHFG